MTSLLMIQCENLEAVVDEIYTGSIVDVIVSGRRTFDKILHKSSQGAGLVLMGMAAPGPDKYVRAYYEQLQNRVRNLPTTNHGCSCARDPNWRSIDTERYDEQLKSMTGNLLSSRLCTHRITLNYSFIDKAPAF